MFKSNFEVKPDEFVTNFVRGEINYYPYLCKKKCFKEGMSASPYETEYHVVYPCREKFLEDLPINSIDYESLKKETSIIVETFEDTRVTFSSFMLIPTYLSCTVKNYFEFETNTSLEFEIETFGGMKIWVNGIEQVNFKSYIRNIPQKRIITLAFEKGINEIFIFFDDLGERDVNYGFSLKNLSNSTIRGYNLVKIRERELIQSKCILESIYFIKDYYDKGEVDFHLQTTLNKKLRIRFNPVINRPPTEMQDGNITEFKESDKVIEINPNQSLYSLGAVSDYQFASTTKVEFGIKLSDDQYITRLIPIAIYDFIRYSQVITKDDVESRKREAINYYSALELDDINVGLSKIFLGKVDDKGDLLSVPGFNSAFKLIESKGDCADFVFVPLLMFYIQYPEKFPRSFKKKLRKMSVDFRYWIDEPGNDVAWYFSENHALLFHTAQYFAGYLFKDEVFSVSGRSGREQYELGKKRIKLWFLNYFKYGLAEWNSVTYIPIDLIGFFSLYNAAPDSDIKYLAKKALDNIFNLISINSFRESYSSTYGRVYEHNLKSIPINELGALTKIAFGIGNFSAALRAAALFCMSEYKPNNGLVHNFRIKDKLIATYKQGVNQAETYIYKTRDFSMASCQNYKYGERGYQQHLFNITLGNSKSSVWINNPGEFKYSGENRPSYWAGNGSLPLIYQHENIALMKYTLTEKDIPFIHLYYPYWEFSYSEQRGNWLLFGDSRAACIMYFSECPELTIRGANAFREYVVKGREHSIFCKCFKVTDNTNLDIEKIIKKIQINNHNNLFEVIDNEDKYQITQNNFFVKNKK